ncbi:MAG: hypothetical protein C0444_04780 [Microbacterium sp.]|nr:hypothetical protein [Microbacterium sp.]MBA4345046.1 hypothetical protein [Microbacterium sp.]
MLGSSPPYVLHSSSPSRKNALATLLAPNHDAVVTHEPTALNPAGLPVDDPALDDDGVPSEFGGYRVVRLLSRSAHALTAVVFASNETRVARIFSRSCSDADIDAAVSVFDRIASSNPVLRDHVVTLDDLVTLDDGRLALIVDHVAGPALSDVLAMRGDGLQLGEAVTILAPLIDAIDAGHAVGLTGLDPHPASVRFTAAGAPTIVRMTDAHAGPVLPERFRALEPAYARDSAMLEHLGAAVAAAVSPSERPALLAALGAAARGRSVSAALFDLATPVPVEFRAVAVQTVPSPALSPSLPGAPRELPVDVGAGADAVTRVQVAAAGAVDATTTTAKAVAPRQGAWADSLVETLRVLGLPPSVVERVQATVTRLSAAREALVTAVTEAPWRRIGTVRPRFVLAGVGGAIALVAALVVTSGAGSEVAVPAAAERATDTVAAGQQPATLPTMTPTAPPSSFEGPSSGATSPESAVDPEPDEWTAIVGELVNRWVECRAAHASGSTTPALERSENVSCSFTVAHAGSAAERLLSVDDARHEALETWRAQGGEVVVVERMGGAALVDLVRSTASASETSMNATPSPATTSPATTAASLLVVRSEAGWRVRDVLDD